MQISELDAIEVIKHFTKSNSFITKQLLRLLATSAEDLYFPYPYENIVMSQTTYKDKFLLYAKNDTSEKAERKLEKLIKGLLHDEKHYTFV